MKRPGDPEPEPAGPGLLPGKALRHAPDHARPHRSLPSQGSVMTGKQLFSRDHETTRRHHQEGHEVERSLLLVHAHPDDESIGTGATMAKYAAEGARVTLVTCTLGELGEIIPPDLSHLLPDELGQHRVVELDRACRALGVEDHRFLGGEGKYRDSGMMGLPDNDAPRCFWQASVEEAAADLVKVIEEVAPDVIVTYDANGFYGHPDHIQAHRVAWRAFELADGLVSKFYATAIPKSVLFESIKAMNAERATSSTTGSPEPDGGAGSRFSAVESVDDLPIGVPD